MRALLKIAVVQSKLFLREPAAFFFTLVFPLLIIVMFGAVFGNTPDPEFNAQFGFIDYETPALTAIIIATIALMGIPVETAASREKKILRRYRTAPINPATYLSATILVYFVMALVGMVLTMLAARLLFGLRFGGNWVSVTAAFTLSALAFFSIGYLIASVASTSRIAQTVGQILFFPMLFLSGAMLPFEMMPETVQRVSLASPLTHSVKLLQNLWFGGAWSESLVQVAVLVATLIVGVSLSGRTFRWE